ncbi:hypothetical protein HYE68_008679 [Fusarium pseudograminearum]|nr:hypothetical protein HYE68_008679 [Fusarium pseudograminearum]
MKRTPNAHIPLRPFVFPFYTHRQRGGIPTKGTTNPGGKKKETEEENRREKKNRTIMTPWGTHYMSLTSAFAN